VSIDGDQTEQLVKLLDSAVIMLEGGTEFDLQVIVLIRLMKHLKTELAFLSRKVKAHFVCVFVFCLIRHFKVLY